MGGQRYWNDGRDVYDVIMGLLDYPETEAHGSFTLSLVTDFEDGGGGATLVPLRRHRGRHRRQLPRASSSPASASSTRPREQVLKGYNSVTTFSNAQQKALRPSWRRSARRHRSSRAVDGREARESFQVPKGYDERFDHFVNFFRSVREGKPVYEDATFGYRAAAPALLCNDSYRQGKMIGWDPVAMRIVS